MSFKVEVCRIASVANHPNADRLDLITLADKDWVCVTAKGNFKPQDLCVYFPVDSILPIDVENKIFGIDAKVKLNGSRVRTIKLRGAVSQGIAASFKTLGLTESKYSIGYDMTKMLGVIKYEPPAARCTNKTAATSKKQTNPHFRKYTGIENAKNYAKLFAEGEDVVVTEKLHGTNFRAGWVPFHASTPWKRFKAWLGVAPKYEFVFGSHNVQLQDKLLYKGYYDKNLYAEAVVKYSLKEKLKPGEVVYGEIIGDGVQKGYTYGCNPGERKLVLFEVMLDGKYIDPIFARKFAEACQLEFVPVIYKGCFIKEKILSLKDGPSVYCPTQKIREGCVVRSIIEQDCYIGRKTLKFISDAYLLANQDEESIGH